ncbi:cyclin-J isoform X1 [Schistocerca americana]|uniref:cyclin-J isoform X1 n=1 Tax=Schistocerca americana TaxID=7009 RepID=UPI001F501210|nr:cyclin-J isoform X1 [Schistocerca americana]XP_049790163.1 cyclin-J isoform X1 [Schistocerca nitens]
MVMSFHIYEMALVRKWWTTDYAKDVVSSLREKERQRIPFNFRSPQIQYRSHLVKWICNIAEGLKLSSTTVHLAIYILDIFMDNHSIALESLNLLTLVSVLLAAKFEERDINVPKVSDMNALIESPYPVAEFLAMEFMTLQFLKWSLVHPTAAHFAEFYVVHIISPADFSSDNHFETYKDLQHAAHHYMKEFLDYSLQDPGFHLFNPSLVAGSCIALARIRLRLSEKWTPGLLEVTQYRLSDLKPCMELIMRVYHLNQPTNKAAEERKRKFTESPDHGYGTCTSVTSSPETSGRS